MWLKKNSLRNYALQYPDCASKNTSLSVHYQVTSTNTIQHRQYLLQAIDMYIFYDLTKKEYRGNPV